MLFSVDLGLWLLSASMDLSDVDFTDKKSPKLAKVIYAWGRDPKWCRKRPVVGSDGNRMEDALHV